MDNISGINSYGYDNYEISPQDVQQKASVGREVTIWDDGEVKNETNEQIEQQQRADNFQASQEELKRQFAEDYANATTDTERAIVMENYQYQLQVLNLTYTFSNLENPTEQQRNQFNCDMKRLSSEHSERMYSLEQHAREEQFVQDYASATNDAEKAYVRTRYEYQSARAQFVYQFSQIEDPTEEQLDQYQANLDRLDRSFREVEHNERERVFFEELAHASSDTERQRITLQYEREQAMEALQNATNTEERGNAYARIQTIDRQLAELGE